MNTDTIMDWWNEGKISYTQYIELMKGKEPRIEGVGNTAILHNVKVTGAPTLKEAMESLSDDMMKGLEIPDNILGEGKVSFGGELGFTPIDPSCSPGFPHDNITGSYHYPAQEIPSTHPHHDHISSLWEYWMYRSSAGEYLLKTRNERVFLLDNNRLEWRETLQAIGLKNSPYVHRINYDGAIITLNRIVEDSQNDK